MFNVFKILFHRTSATHDGVNLRRWFIFFSIYLVVLAVVALAGLNHYGQNLIWLAAIYLFYMSLCCTFFPAPTAWIVLLMASPVVVLVPGDLFSQYFGIAESDASIWTAFATIIVVAAIGAIGTMLANLNEYHIFTFLLRFGRVRRIRQTRFYQTINRYFSASPFLLMTTVSFLPVPVDIVRWLAISNRYHRSRYALACFLGRFARYSLMAAAATCLKIGWLGIVIIQLVIIVLVALRYLIFTAKKSSADQFPPAMATEKIIPTQGISS